MHVYRVNISCFFPVISLQKSENSKMTFEIVLAKAPRTARYARVIMDNRQQEDGHDGWMLQTLCFNW